MYDDSLLINSNNVLYFKTSPVKQVINILKQDYCYISKL